MTTTITAILTVYGFEVRPFGVQFWDIGSLMWGHTAAVKAIGNDLYEVTIAHWAYDEWADPLYDMRETRILHGALALSWIFSEMPVSFWRRG